MKKQIFFPLAVTVLLSLLAAEQSSGSFFSSLQLTRDALMDFSRGSQRTVEIKLEPKETTRMVNKTYELVGSKTKMTMFSSLKKVDESVMKTAIPGFVTIPSDLIKDSLDPSVRKDLPKKLLTTMTHDRGLKRVILVPVTLDEKMDLLG